MRRVPASLLLVLLLGTPASTQMIDGPKADDYPIIAELYGDPARYAGHLVMIYGLVVERVSESQFMLQDVSQRPLKIVETNGLKAAVGDQLIVIGKFHAAPGQPYLSATSFFRTLVLGGGGCC